MGRRTMAQIAKDDAQLKADVADLKAHYAPTACYVCGNGPHAAGEHDYWANIEAAAYFAQQPGGGIPSMSAVETLDPREAVLS